MNILGNGLLVEDEDPPYDDFIAVSQYGLFNLGSIDKGPVVAVEIHYGEALLRLHDLGMFTGNDFRSHDHIIIGIPPDFEGDLINGVSVFFSLNIFEDEV